MKKKTSKTRTGSKKDFKVLKKGELKKIHGGGGNNWGRDAAYTIKK